MVLQDALAASIVDCSQHCTSSDAVDVCLVLSAAGFDHFCLVVQSDDINDVKQQLAAVGMDAEPQFDGVVVTRYGAQGNARSIYIRDPGLAL